MRGEKEGERYRKMTWKVLNVGTNRPCITAEESARKKKHGSVHGIINKPD